MIAPGALRAFDFASFESAHDFPWQSLSGFLAPDAFAQLYADFPSLDFFEAQTGLEREHGQRPHNRYYLAYEQSIYNKSAKKGSESGVIKREDLRPSWQQFIDELNARPYQEFLASVLGTRHFQVRFAWHVGYADVEVSPHRDHPAKLGTQLFYFNTQHNWRKEWGGEFLALEQLRDGKGAPEIADFAKVSACKIMDNHGVLFKNTKLAWHGVAPLNCPPSHFRQVFNVIAEARPPQRLRDLPLRLARKLVREAKDFVQKVGG